MPIQKAERRMLSARGVSGEAGSRVMPPSVPQGFAPPTALPSRDPVASRQARAVPSKLAPLPASGKVSPAAPSQRRESPRDSNTEAQTPQDPSSPMGPLLPEVELLEGQFSAVSSQLREQTTQLIESQHALQRQAESLEKLLKETCIAKEAEVAHSRKLAEAFSRESARCEDIRQEVEAARVEKQILQAELDDLQIKRFRATELSSQSGIDQELLMVLKAENDSLMEELRHTYARPDIEEQIKEVSRGLAQQKPVMQQLRKDLTEAYMSNTELQQQNDRLAIEISSLREELGIPESSPELELSDLEDNDTDEENCVSMSIDEEEKEMQLSLRIRVPQSVVNQLAVTM